MKDIVPDPVIIPRITIKIQFYRIIYEIIFYTKLDKYINGRCDFLAIVEQSLLLQIYGQTTYVEKLRLLKCPFICSANSNGDNAKKMAKQKNARHSFQMHKSVFISLGG